MKEASEKLSVWTRMLDALDTPWVRPAPTGGQKRFDVLTWLLYLLGTQLMALAYLSAGLFQNIEPSDIWKEFVAMGAMTLPLIFRRIFPISMLVVSTVLFYAVGYWALVASSTLAFQIAYFAVLYSAVAWAQDRRNLWIVYVLVMLSTLVWLVANWTIQGSACSMFGPGFEGGGPFSVPVGTFILGVLINGLFYGGALMLGDLAWKNAYHQEVLRQQREQIIVQSDRLAQDAVVEDRLRIARELHDSIGHHIAAIGIQATAAQRLATKKPELLVEPLANIEELSRTSVTEMRAVLGVLRADESADRDPQLSDVSALVQVLEEAKMKVSFTRDEARTGTIDGLSQGVSLSLYRIVQEATNNIIKHSSAQRVDIALRSSESWVEVEVTDDGKAAGAASSRIWGSDTPNSGYGLRGIRERAQVLGGEVEIGERQGHTGWRVRVRVPVK